MKAMLKLPHRTTYTDYLVVEQMSERRHEFIDGVIIAMAGGSHEHIRIAGRFAGVLTTLAPPDCFYHTADQRFWIQVTGHGRYSDGSLVCGDPENPAHDRQANMNPIILIEVMSPSSEVDDHGAKRRDYQSLASLQAYVVASQDRRLVQLYRRNEHGAWHSEPTTYRDGDSFELPRLAQPIYVHQIYDGILDRDGRSLLR